MNEYTVLLTETRQVTFRVYVDADSPEQAAALAAAGSYDEEEIVDESAWDTGATKVLSVKLREQEEVLD